MINCSDIDEKVDKKSDKKRLLQDIGYKNISIYIDSYFLNKSLSGTQNKKKFNVYYEALIKAKNALQKLIKVPTKPSGINLVEYKQIIKTDIFYEEDDNYDDFYNSSIVDGFNSDLIIFAFRSGQAGSLESNKLIKNCGEYPQIHKYNDDKRPIIGSILIDESYYETIVEEESENKYKIEFYSYIFLHQLTHILGFNSDIFNKIENKIQFIEIDVYRIKENVPIKKKAIQCNNTNCKLLEFARNYFNCSTLKYLELEDKESNFTECHNYFHWETRIFSGEYMTSNIYIQEQVISEFTLYLLEETGLYQVYNFTGGLMRFGKHVGCQFFTKDCNTEKPPEEIHSPNQTTVRNSIFLNEFCSSGTKSTCSPGRLSRGLCNNKLPESMMFDPDYKRTDSDIWKNYGNSYADYCPISISENEVPIEGDETYSYIGNCKLGNNKSSFGKLIFYYYYFNFLYSYSIFPSDYGENFSDTSFCAFSSVIHKDDKNQIYEGFIHPTCYQMTCSDLSLTIRINDQFIVCPRSGGYVNIGGNYIGHIFCPDYYLICSQTIPCNNLFDCVDKGSRMKEDYKYDYKPDNSSMQIIEIYPNATFDPAYELSNNGNQCPVNCSQCYKNKKCFSCRYNIYKGERENDNNPVICPYEAPELYYYKKNNTHYFKCIDNCLICNKSNECFQCLPDYRLDSKYQCVPRIEGCVKYNESNKIRDPINNNKGWAYKECETCNNIDGYYCIDSNKEACNKTDVTSYFLNDLGCLTKCEPKYENCFRCNKSECLECKSGYYPNSQKKCVLGIKHCNKLNLQNENPICIKCEDNYRCLNRDQTICNKIDNLDSYYYIDDNRDTNDCMEKCSNTYNEKCIRCTKDECLNCEDNYLLYGNKDCIQKLDYCIEHFYDGKKVTCLECEQNYYCINNNKSICSYIPEDNLHIYYKVDNDPNPCYEECFEAIPYCIECDNKDICTLCQPLTNLTEGKCIPYVPPPGKCEVSPHEINDNINNINLKMYPNNFVNNYPNYHTIDHYVNKNYTISVFIHSECTEVLLKEGYFKINCTDIQYSLADKFGSNINLTYAVFVTHNYRSHLRFYSEYLEHLNSDSAQNKEYIITNYFYSSIQKEFGSLVANLIISNKINIFYKDSDIFNDYCRNLTFSGIDMPLKQRAILYTHKFSERMACLGENCEIVDINYDNSTTTCKCIIGNTFEDILLEDDQFETYDGIIKGQNNFIDSIGIIKCTKSGFKNLAANIGFYLVIIGIIAQISLYIIYALCGKPITKLPKRISNPPKKTTLMIFSDWDRTKKKINQSENEVYIQPRDEDDDQLTEEERSYIVDENINFSDVSIDTNVGGINLRSDKNYREKPNKKILILLNNKGDKKSKSQKEYEEINSESEISLNNKEEDLSKKSFCRIYLTVVTLKQHIINFFSVIYCLKITKSHIPFTIQIIRSLFLFFLSFVLNILFLNQSYYITKFNHFNEKYIFLFEENQDIEIPTGEKISYAIDHTFGYAMVVFIFLIIVNFLIGYIFFYLRNKIIEIKKKNNFQEEIKKLVKNQKNMNLIFFIINIVLMLIFLLTITAFVGAYGGGFVDYFTAGIISLIFLELFPFLWSLIITLLFYFGQKKNNNFLKKFAEFFMF